MLRSIERSYYSSNYSRPFATAHRHHDGVAYEHLQILGITMCCSLLILSQVRCHISHGLGRQPATYSLHMCKAPVPDIPVAPIQSQVMSVVLSGCNMAYCTSQISVHKPKYFCGHLHVPALCRHHLLHTLVYIPRADPIWTFTFEIISQIDNVNPMSFELCRLSKIL